MRHQSHRQVIFGKIIQRALFSILNSISVTRKYLFTICQENKIEIEEVESSFDTLSEADAVFILSTAKHAVAISRVNDISYEENNLVQDLQNLYNQLVESERNRFS